MVRAVRRFSAVLAAGALAAAGVAVAGGPAYAVDPVAGAQTAGDSLFPNQGNGGYDVSHYDINFSVDVTPSATNDAVGTTNLPAATTTIDAATTGAPAVIVLVRLPGLQRQPGRGHVQRRHGHRQRRPGHLQPHRDHHDLQRGHRQAQADHHAGHSRGRHVHDGGDLPRRPGHALRHRRLVGGLEQHHRRRDLPQPAGRLDDAVPQQQHAARQGDLHVHRRRPDHADDLQLRQRRRQALPGRRGQQRRADLQDPNGDGTRTTWVWNQTEPMASELSLVSVGRYDIYESDIHLELSGRTIHEWTFIDPAISVANQTTTLGTRAQLKAVLDFYESRYGPYPGNSTGARDRRRPEHINYALETQDRPFFPNSASRGTTTTRSCTSGGVTTSRRPTGTTSPSTRARRHTPSSSSPFEGAGSTTTSTEQANYNALHHPRRHEQHVLGRAGRDDQGLAAVRRPGLREGLLDPRGAAHRDRRRRLRDADADSTRRRTAAARSPDGAPRRSRRWPRASRAAT